MRILLDQAAHDMRNKGNNALLEVAASRLTRLFPQASFHILTLAPNLTRLYYPWAEPVYPANLTPHASKSEKILRIIPKNIQWLLFELREARQHRQSQSSQFIHKKIERNSSSVEIDSGAGNSQQSTEVPEVPFGGFQTDRSLLGPIMQYDLVVACGGGYMCDSDKPRLLDVLKRLNIAVERGIPAVMVGQGVGPLDDPELRARAREVLPRLDMIFVREKQNTFPLLAGLGVPESKLRMTGDDAIELAYGVHPEQLGEAVGVSVRVSSYTQVNQSHIETLRSVLLQFGSDHLARLIGVPISSAHHESDIAHIRNLTDGYKEVSIRWRKLDPPLEVIREAAKCRIILAGTYHGAIFGLSQGIPVVAVARSEEYFNKLSGLPVEFGSGCRVIHLDDEDLAGKLFSAMRFLWDSAEQLRPELLESAERQIQWGRDAYDYLGQTVQAKLRTRLGGTDWITHGS